MRVVKQKDVSRREFSRDLVKLLLAGGFSHFALPLTSLATESVSSSGHVCLAGGHDSDMCMLKSEAKGISESDNCPGGGPVEDVCLPEQHMSDYCPGEMLPEDECSSTGGRTVNGHEDDACDVGSSDADVCNTTVRGADQCASGHTNDDLCLPKASDDDKCYSGRPNDDECASDGGIDEDACPGGGAEVDTCEPNGNGDECSNGSWVMGGAADEDDCKAGDPDKCATISLSGLLDDDTCITGKNASRGDNGIDDWCRGDALASDTCWSGKDDDDLCLSLDDENGAHDDCPGGKATLDVCGANSDDYCSKADASSDDCKPNANDMDECPDGGADADECILGMPSSDECPMGQSDSDVCSASVAGTDECVSDLIGSDQPPDICTFIVLDWVE